MDFLCFVLLLVELLIKLPILKRLVLHLEELYNDLSFLLGAQEGFLACEQLVGHGFLVDGVLGQPDKACWTYDQIRIPLHGSTWPLNRWLLSFWCLRQLARLLQHLVCDWL